MKYNFILLLMAVFFSCKDEKMVVGSTIRYSEILPATDTLYSFSSDENDAEMSCGYKNSKGDTIIPFGKYMQCFTDTFIHFAIVYDKNNTDSKMVAINQKDEIIFDVYTYDNGPDYIRDGLFRIKRNGKIGYANEKGEIVIEPVYACANPFENGKAKVALRCTLTKEGEYTRQESDAWFYIDKNGNKVE
jgi:WG containing repeat